MVADHEGYLKGIDVDQASCGCQRVVPSDNGRAAEQVSRLAVD